MFYIDQLCTPSFPILLGWLKLNLALLLDHLRLAREMNACGSCVISVDTYPCLDFSDLTCHLEDTGIGAFWLHCAA